MRDPYQVLGISAGASDDEIKKAYRNLSRKYHPDANVNNPNKATAEEKFKEVQQAYDQIMKEKQSGGSYGYNYGGYGNGNGYGGATYRYSYSNRSGYGSSAEESTQMRAAANYIANRYYREAMNVLNNMSTADRNARWYYYSAVANQGMGNNIVAKQHAQTAVQLEPNNFEYRQFLQQLEYGDSWYTEMGRGYARPYSSTGSWCLSMMFLNLFCNCCCRPC